MIKVLKKNKMVSIETIEAMAVEGKDTSVYFSKPKRMPPRIDIEEKSKRSRSRRKILRFTGFGFPVILQNVPIRTEYGSEIPDVNFKMLQEQLFQAVLLKPQRLSGAEVKFLRSCLGLTQEEFSNALIVKRSSISKWESKDLKATGMSPHIEMFLRQKLAAFKRKSKEIDFSTIEPAATSKGVGKPIELKLKAS